MFGKKVSTLVVFIAVMGLSSAVMAQENGLGMGKYTVAFAVPSGGGALIGGRYFLSGEAAVGLDFGYSITVPKEGDSTGGFTILPSYTYYLMTTSRLLTFVKGAINITKLEGIDFGDAVVVDLGGFFGVEFFVTKEFSLAGELGIAINIRDSFESFTSQTGTGSLFAQFYF